VVGEVVLILLVVCSRTEKEQEVVGEQEPVLPLLPGYQHLMSSCSKGVELELVGVELQ
jgi:hypothetical protein